jgi:hypothetical protein
VDQAILGVLTRQAVPALDAVTAAIEDSRPEDARYRADLYGVLCAAALAPSERVQRRLRDFAWQRVDAWRVPVDEAETEAAALGALVHAVDDELMHDESETRPIVVQGWRETAQDIARRFGARA